MDAEEAGQSAAIITRSALFLYTNKPMDAAGPKKKEGNETEPAHLVVMANTQDTHRPDGIIIL